MPHDLLFFSLSSFLPFPLPTELTWKQESACVQQKFRFQKCSSLGTIWTEKLAKIPNFMFYYAGFFVCFLWTELRHSNSFQIAAKEKRPHCPWIESQHITGENAQLLGLLENLYTKTSCFSLCFQQTEDFTPEWHRWLDKEKTGFLHPTSRSLCEVKLCLSIKSLWNFIQNRGQKSINFHCYSFINKEIETAYSMETEQLGSLFGGHRAISSEDFLF